VYLDGDEPSEPPSPAHVTAPPFAEVGKLPGTEGGPPIKYGRKLPVRSKSSEDRSFVPPARETTTPDRPEAQTPDPYDEVEAPTNADGEPVDARDLEEDLEGGELDKFGIADVLRGQMGDIKDCYESWLKENPDLEGRLVVEFAIEADPEDPDIGVVTEVDIPDTDVDHVWMEGCVARVVSEAEFPPPADGGTVTVRYPFEFSSGE